jgi:hypothetical protein
MSDHHLSDVVSLVGQLQPALERNARASIIEIVGQLVALRAPMGDQWQQLALIAAGFGEHKLARAAMDLLVDAMGADPAARYQKAALLALIGEWREAFELIQALPEDVPDRVSNSYSRGMAALYVGKFDEAQRLLEQVTHWQPQSGPTWLALASTVNLSRAPELAERLFAVERAMQSAPVADRAPYHFALGKARDDRGEHAQAADAFARGARNMKSLVSYDPDKDLAEAQRAVDGYDAARIAAIAELQRESTGRTIFVAGLPRSGTTLVEQILTCHSSVSDGGEISRLTLLANEIGGADWPTLARHVKAHGEDALAQLWDHWLDELFPVPGRIVDKTVTTSRFLGLAAALLPQAPLIWMTRDPLDRAWSCFRTNFAGTAMPWSYDQQDMAIHFRIEDRLLAQWQAILGERLLVLSYEALVSEPEAWIPRLLAHCGLAEEPKVYAPHQNIRPVATASMVQVRRPISRGSIGAAEPYRSFLAPFIEAYFG